MLKWDTAIGVKLQLHACYRTGNSIALPIRSLDLFITALTATQHNRIRIFRTHTFQSAFHRGIGCYLAT